MIVDGGLGGELARRGYHFTTSLWSGQAVLDAPDLLAAIHYDFAAAGAQIISTATYQMAHESLRADGYDDAGIDAVFAAAVALARRGVSAASAGVGQAPLVALSLGPYGATRGDGSEYAATQHLEPDALYAFHAERARAAARAQPDLFLFETIPTRAEACVIARVVHDLRLGPVWISLSCRDGARTFGGDDIAATAAALDAFAGVDVVGVNCTAPAAIAPAVRALRAGTAKPIAVCPNLGQHWDDAGGLVGGDTDDELIGRVPDWLRLGVAHIGGCCGVAPATIHAIRTIVDAASASSARG